MLNSINILSVPGFAINTEINPISLIASGSYYDKLYHLHTVLAPTGTPELPGPPTGEHFLTFLLMPVPNIAARRLEIVNSLLTTWLVMQPFNLREDRVDINASVVRVLDGSQNRGLGLFFPLSLFDRPSTDNETITID